MEGAFVFLLRREVERIRWSRALVFMLIAVLVIGSTEVTRSR